jgi:P-type Mg2+ transporter
MLLGAALLSFGLDSPTDGLIILVIVLVSGLLGFWQEHGAERAVQKLLAVVELRCSVWRDGVEVSIPMAEVVRGDWVRLAAGDGIPGDCRLVEGRDLCVDEAALTGESFPVEKRVDQLAEATPLAQRVNVLHLGTHVVSGSGRAVVVHIGRSTAFGAIADRHPHRGGGAAGPGIGCRRPALPGGAGAGPSQCPVRNGFRESDRYRVAGAARPCTGAGTGPGDVIRGR